MHILHCDCVSMHDWVWKLAGEPWLSNPQTRTCSTWNLEIRFSMLIMFIAYHKITTNTSTQQLCKYQNTRYNDTKTSPDRRPASWLICTWVKLQLRAHDAAMRAACSCSAATTSTCLGLLHPLRPVAHRDRHAVDGAGRDRAGLPTHCAADTATCARYSH